MEEKRPEPKKLNRFELMKKEIEINNAENFNFCVNTCLTNFKKDFTFNETEDEKNLLDFIESYEPYTIESGSDIIDARQYSFYTGNNSRITVDCARNGELYSMLEVFVDGNNVSKEPGTIKIDGDFFCDGNYILGIQNALMVYDYLKSNLENKNNPSNEKIEKIVKYFEENLDDILKNGKEYEFIHRTSLFLGKKDFDALTKKSKKYALFNYLSGINYLPINTSTQLSNEDNIDEIFVSIKKELKTTDDLTSKYILKHIKNRIGDEVIKNTELS